jgi:ribosomal protein S18 acetylase RimI-like enzyme
VRPAGDGWLLRATPGLDRARSNNALTPCRPLSTEEIPPALERVRAFAREHAVKPGIQVSPARLHEPLQQVLDDRGWSREWPTQVLIGPAGGQDHPPEPPEPPGLSVDDHASRAWLDAWSRCEPGRDVEAHARTVFSLLRGRAAFARVYERAVAIAVEDDGLLGLFCVAVDPDQRRTGLATRLMRVLLARSRAGQAYLQVDARNAAAIAMYVRLGFTEAYTYCHRSAPA